MTFFFQKRDHYSSILLMNKRLLEERLLKLCFDVDRHCFAKQEIIVRPYLRDQVLRSSSSALLNYGEAEVAESRKDFIHKLSIVLKELNESYLA